MPLPLALCVLGRTERSRQPPTRLHDKPRSAPDCRPSRARTTRGSTFRQATRVNPARSEDRKMVYDGNFLHFMVRGSVGQYFQRAGGRPARARTDHPAVVGSTEMPRHHILAVHLARSSRPTRRRTRQSLRCHWTSVRTHTAEVYAHSTSGSDVECDIPRGCNSQTAVSAERTLSRGLNRLRSSWFGT
jgi:hypothetical protein